MRVLILGPKKNPLVARLCSALRRNGIQVFIAAFDIDNNIEDSEYSLGALSGYRSYIYSPRLNQIINEVKPDLIHAHVINHYGLLAIWQKKIPVLITLWGSDVMLAPKEGNILKRLTFKMINSLVYRRCSAVHSSSYHVINELKKNSVFQNEKKEFVIYWGMPLKQLDNKERTNIANRLKKEFGVGGSLMVVFPRGVKEIYNPDVCLKIINLWRQVNPKREIVLFKAFSQDQEFESLKLRVENPNCKFVNRVLDDDELSYIYSNTLAHVSIPVSDCLGGGVVEPYLFGSKPVLSNIKPYRDFLSEREGVLLQGKNDKEILRVILDVEKSKNKSIREYKEDPAYKMIEMYSQVSNV